MLTYTFSRREKILILILALILVFVLWFIFVYQGTTNQIMRLEGEISAANTTIEANKTRISQKSMMEDVIKKREAEGAAMTEVPNFDNIKPLMAELNNVMGMAESYTLSFDDLDTSKDSYVLRGVGIQFGCGSYEQAESIVGAISGGPYPCVVDTVAISDNTTSSRAGRIVGRTTNRSAKTTNSNYSATVHVTFLEKA